MHQINWPRNIFVLIPSYKSVRLLEKFLKSLESIVPKEVILIVDDASMDGTDAMCKDNGIDVISHCVNKGKGAALATGFKHLVNKGAQWIITMDADGQHAPEDLALFYTMAQNKSETGICIGARDMRIGHMPFARILSNRITSGILSLLAGTEIKDSQCGYRIYNADFIKKINIEYNRFEMESEVILKAHFLGFPVCFVPVQTLYLDGGSHISHLKDTIRWTRATVKVWLNRSIYR